MKRLALGLALAGCLVLPAAAQEVSGRVFHDKNGNGIVDAGEEGLADVAVRLAGQADSSGTLDQSTATATDGLFSFSPGNGCYLLRVEDPPGWRRTLARYDRRAEGSAGYVHPVGLRRWGGAPELLASALAGNVRYSSLGDSIAWNWNSCFDTSSFWYSKEVRDRLRCAFPGASVTLDEAAVKGEHSDDLLLDESDMNNVFRVIDAQSELVTISIIGNDLLGDEPGANPTQEDINRAVEEVLDSRANLQEILSSLVAGIPDAAIELNTLYDNLADDCNSSPFHTEWLPLVNQMLRDLAWGQARRVTNAEVSAEFALEDLTGGCDGFEDQICHFLGDDIHPTGDGYEIIREKVWESIGGASLGPKDALGASSLDGADHGYLRRVHRLLPTRAEALAGAALEDGENAFDDDDGGLAARATLGLGSEEVRFAGFPAWLDELVPVRVVAGVRYHTSGAVTGDFYRIEASVDGAFRAPAGHAYTPTDWNFYTPIVGSGGPNAPALAPDYPGVKTLVQPNVATPRTASATLTKNPVVSADGRGYEWPALTLEELGTTEIRLVAAPVDGSAAEYALLVDAVWLDVYGLEKERPQQVGNLDVARESDGALTLTFDEAPSAQRYNVYFGSLAELAASGTFDHGSGDSQCDTPTSAAGPGRRSTRIDASAVPAGPRYVLVTAHVDDVESPTGVSSEGQERDRSQNTCP